MRRPPAELESLDFRLLVVFDTVLELKSLTRAALRLQVSQPAVSQALGRLRRRLGDPLFVRSADGLAPTPRAERLAGPVQRILAIYREEVAVADGFDAATSRREFSCYITDLGAALMMPALIRRLASLAPGTLLRTASIESDGIAAGLEAGKVDLAIGPFPRMPGAIFQQRLFEDDFVCLARKAHPLLKGGLTLEAFQAADHVLVDTTGTGHAFNPLVETAIARQVPPARIRLRVHSFTLAVLLMRDTQLLLTVPRRSGGLMAREFGLVALDLPIELRSLEINQYWHQRFQNDAGHRWFRAQVGELFNRPGRRRPS